LDVQIISKLICMASEFSMTQTRMVLHFLWCLILSLIEF